LAGAALFAGVTVAATAGAAGGVVTGRAENRHHAVASTTAVAAPIMTGVSADRRLAVCTAVTVFAGPALMVGVNFCPVSGDESDFTGTPVIEAIACVSGSTPVRGGGNGLVIASPMGTGAVRCMVTPVTAFASSSANSRQDEYRASGSFASALRNTMVTSSPRSWRCCLTGGGSTLMI